MVPNEGLVLWLNAEAAIENPSLVWKDWTASIPVTQTASNLVPKLDPAGFNGKPTGVFDGVDDYLNLPPMKANFAGGLSIFMAVQQDRSGFCTTFFDASNGPELDDIALGQVGGALLYEVYQTYIDDSTHKALLGVPQVVVAVHETSQEAHLRSNSLSEGELLMGLPAPVTREQVFLGRSLYGSCVPFAGRISEILLYERAVSDAELTRIEGYLQMRWGCCATRN